MLEIQKILVPIDFSDHSRKALGYGLSLAMELEAKLVLAHIVPVMTPIEAMWPVAEIVPEDKLSDVEEKLRGLVDDETQSWCETDFIAVAGDVDDKLLEIVEDERPDLIVMGTHGRRRFERWMIGSVTERALRRLAIPIMTVAHLDGDHVLDRPKPIPLGRILVATDLGPGSSDAMDIAISLSEEFSTELTFLHVVRRLGWEYPADLLPPAIVRHAASAREAIFEKLVNSVPESLRRQPSVRIELVDGQPAESILKFADANDVDLIVLGTQDRSGLDRALLGSTAERVVRGAHIPVLSVPPRQGAGLGHLKLGEGGVLI